MRFHVNQLVNFSGRRALVVDIIDEKYSLLDVYENIQMALERQVLPVYAASYEEGYECDIHNGDYVQITNRRHNYLYGKKLQVKKVIGQVLLLPYGDTTRFVFANEVTKVPANGFVCMDCGRVINQTYDSYITHYGRRICNACRQNYSYCANCEDLFPDDELDSDELCADCQSRGMQRCRECGCWFDEDDLDADGYCEDCRPDDFIHEYSYKPEPEFFGDAENDKYMGVELEIGKGGYSNVNAEVIMAGKSELYAKEDGSVDQGFELVTHPMSIDYHLNEFGWEGIMDRAKARGYAGPHGTGIHVHVSRDFFGTDYETQSEHISNLIYFVEKNWQEIVTFARRTPGEIEQWSGRYLRHGENYADYSPAKLMDVARRNGSRYHAINLRNSDTVEIRIFRSTTNVKIMRAYLQFVDVITDLSKDKELAGNFDFHTVLEYAKGKGYTEAVDLICELLQYPISA